MADLFAALDALVAECPVVVDRPKGSRHPRYPEVVYPVDYGYLEGTTAGDGDGIDVFRGSATGVGVVGVSVTVDPHRRDAEVKVLLDCSPADMAAIQALVDARDDLGARLILRDG